ncbi:MAG: molybdopterin-dependent oxidoreductase, partial [Actinomycetota bacterium]
AECHPVGFRWPMEAKRRGAKLIHVDPRFTRTSAVCDLHVPIRAGSDIAFLGGIVNYIIDKDRWFKEYVVNYTNAAALIVEGFADTEDLDGMFSGWNEEKQQYDIGTWQYRGGSVSPAAGNREMFPGEAESDRRIDTRPEDFDPTLQDPHCVFQILKKHFRRYTPEMVQEVCGCSKELFLEVAEALCENSGRERTSAICYSVGWTQHTVGVQYIRTAAIIQLLLGNMGRPGGGILALRGHASIQGSTDIPTLYDLLPGYLPMPKASTDTDFGNYVGYNRSGSGWWGEFPKYIVSLLKAWFADAATEENDWAYGYLPRLTGDHSHMPTVTAMADGKIDGYLVMGENPVVGSMNGPLQRKGLSKLKWLVVRDLVLTETAEFWKNGGAGEIATEVFFFPAAAHTEKDGTFTNTQRLLQWHSSAVAPPGDARSELHFLYHLGRRLKELCRGKNNERDRPLLDLTWDYPLRGPHEEPDAESVLREINGYRTDGGEPIASFNDLKADGTTACGAWIYSGVFAEGNNHADRRRPWSEQTWVAPEWGWAWPANRRILYNRASADPQGRPWSARKAYVWWDEEQQAWTGQDQPDYIKDRPPTYRPPEDAEGPATLSGIDPFILQADGKGWLFVPGGLADGPLPTHYEPAESPVRNPLYRRQANPARLRYERKDNRRHRTFRDPKFPYVITTYRLTEHHTAGGMSRWLPWLSELQPEMFCEVSPALAAEKGLRHGGWATVSTARSQIECRVLVTPRMADLKIRGRTVRQIGLPYHWGSSGLSRGDAANDLISFVGDPNVSIQESKALTGNIEPGRRPRDRDG